MKKYWIDESEGHPVMMTTNGRLPWKECFKESWRSLRESEPNYAIIWIFVVIAVGVVITLFLHSLLS
jgi:hypothetical protein